MSESFIWKHQAFMHKRITSSLSAYLLNSKLRVDREIKRKVKWAEECKMISAGRKEQDVPTSTARLSFGEKSSNYTACASCPRMHKELSDAPRWDRQNLPLGTGMAQGFAAAPSCSTITILLFSFPVGRILQQ